MNDVGRFFRDLFIGAPIVFLGTAMVSGGIEDACALILISVVCTLGAGLLVWLPLCWFVGWLVMRVVATQFEAA